jgi:uncharacterized membrane protein YdbT with pleckstrin-like domain
MSSYVKRAMQPNESILYAAQLHWIIYRMGATITLLGVLFGRYAGKPFEMFFGDGLNGWTEKPIMYISIGLIAVGAFELIADFIRQISTELVITDQRVIAKHGFISTTSYELMLTKVEGATIEQTIIGRMLGYGTLMVKGTGGGISPIDHVADPYKFHSHLMNALRDAQEGNNHNTNHHD